MRVHPRVAVAEGVVGAAGDVGDAPVRRPARARLVDQRDDVVELEADQRQRRVEQVRQVDLDWFAVPAPEPPQMRDPGLLQLYFAAFAAPRDVTRLAGARADALREQLAVADAVAERLEVARRPYQLAVLNIGRSAMAAMLDGWQSLPRQPRASVSRRRRPRS